jgi:hypothetical protein
MSSNINDKNSPNQMRVFMKRMREGDNTKGYIVEGEKTYKKDMSMRDLLKLTRTLNEEFNGEADNDSMNDVYEDKKLDSDQKREEDSIRALFENDKVAVTPSELIVKYKNDNDWYVIFGGIIDGMIKFSYTVTPDEKTSEVTVDKYSDGVNIDNPDVDNIIKKLESYYSTFYRYWKENILQS